MNSEGQMGCSPSQPDAAAIPPAPEKEVQEAPNTEIADGEDAASHVDTAVAGVDVPHDEMDELSVQESRDSFPVREEQFEWKAPATLRTASVPALVANKQAKQDAFIGRAFSAPATYTPLDAEDMRMQAVRGIHMNLFLRRRSSVEGDLGRLPSVSLAETQFNEEQKTETVKMMKALLRELPNRSDGAAALQHLEAACKELGMERGRRNSLSMMPQDTIQEDAQDDDEEEEELSLEGIIQDMQQTC